MEHWTERMSPSPTKSTERLHALDVLRGVAIFGILVVNVEQMFLPQFYANDPVAAVPGEVGSAFAWFVTDALFESKFLTLFSLLFGAGFALQWQRAAEGGKGFIVRFLRRLLLLGLFGVVHAVFFYASDVLLIYAVTALALVPWRRARARPLVVAGSVLLMLTIAWGGVISGPGPEDSALRKRAAAEAVARARASGRIELPEMVLDRPDRIEIQEHADWRAVEDGRKLQIPPTEHALPMPADVAILVLDSGGRYDEAQALVQYAVLSQGPLLAALFARLIHLAALVILYLPVYLGWRTLALFLLGFAVVVAGKVEDPGSRFWRRARTVGLACGLPISLVASAIRLTAFDTQSPWIYLGTVLHEISSLLLAAGFGGAVFLWVGRGLRSPWSRRCAAVGRTALTNYIGQSVVMSLLATSYGLGLFGGLARLQLLGLAVGCFAVQMVVSAWWLARFRYGPLEWLWRCFTYWQRVPFARPGPGR